HALMFRGQFALALASLRRGHELGSRNPKWPDPSGNWIKECQHLMTLDGRLSAILKGDVTPASTAERLELARLCGFKSLYGASAQFFADAFVAQPALVGNLQPAYCYQAARTAAQAGCGQGKDAPPLDAQAQAHWRGQALSWLWADLA